MDNRCVVCGEIVPEGRQICHACESRSLWQNGVENETTLEDKNEQKEN